MPGDEVNREVPPMSPKASELDASLYNSLWRQDEEEGLEVDEVEPPAQHEEVAEEDEEAQDRLDEYLNSRDE